MIRILFFILLFSAVGHAQQLHYRTGGNVTDANNRKINADSVRVLMKDNPAALQLFNTIGGAMMIASFPVKGGYTKKVKAALEDYNKTVVYQPTFNPKLNVIATSDGLGVAIRF